MAHPYTYIPPGRFLVFISVRGLVDLRVIVRLEGLGRLNEINDFIGNQIRDLSACSIVTQANRLPRAVSERKCLALMMLNKGSMDHCLIYIYLEYNECTLQRCMI
jgi:hypothetical protein